MKALFATVLLWGGLFLPLLHAQEINKTDTLKIYDQDRLMIKVTSPQIQNLKKGTRMINLLDAFRNNFESIQSQIPEYTIYEIYYEKDASLRIEEVEGVVRYQVTNGITSMGFNQSVAYLKEDNLVISLYFNELADLLDKKYDSMLGSAFAKVGKPPGRIREVYFPINVYNYSYSKGEMMKRNNPTPRKYNIAIPISLTTGVFKGSLMVEWGVGLGAYIGRRKRSFLYAFFNDSYTYDKELDTALEQPLWGVALSTPRGSFSIAFPSDEDEIYDDISVRIGGSSKVLNNVMINFYWYVGKETLHPGFSIGVGF